MSDKFPINPISVESAETSLVPISTIKLNEESAAIISQLIDETDEQKTKDLTQLFNANQNKKTMVRVNKLSDLLDTITDQAYARFTSRPDEISNKELFDGLKIVNDLIERGQKQVSAAGEAPLIQINQQTNEVNLGSGGAVLNRESRERVKAAVGSLLASISKAATNNAAEDSNSFDISDCEVIEIDPKEDTEVQDE